MPDVYRVVLHENGPALWPEHKSLEEVNELEATTPEATWYGTYQGTPTAPGGVSFNRSWWAGPRMRYNPVHMPRITQLSYRRYISWDTANKNNPSAAWTAWAVGELMPDYRLLIREVGRVKTTFPGLPPIIREVASAYMGDHKLQNIIIEDEASGTQAVQTLQESSEAWIAGRITPFIPEGGKEMRAAKAAVWCKNGCVLLPMERTTPWSEEFEDELFTFPGSVYKDQVDAFSQLVNFLAPILADGWRRREGIA